MTDNPTLSPQRQPEDQDAALRPKNLAEFVGQEAAREKQLKNWRRQWKINLINAENPEWRDLAVGLGLPPLAPRLRPDGS